LVITNLPVLCGRKCGLPGLDCSAACCENGDTMCDFPWWFGNGTMLYLAITLGQVSL
jgi:hypothetical protein